MRCIICKEENEYTLWDKVRLFLFGFFKEDIQDLSEDKFTKGFGEGYAAGYDRSAKERMPALSQEKLDNYMKQWTK